MTRQLQKKAKSATGYLRSIRITKPCKALQWQDGKVLMVTWKSEADFDKYIKNQSQTTAQEAYVTWVTAAPQVKEIADYPVFTRISTLKVSAHIPACLGQGWGIPTIGVIRIAALAPESISCGRDRPIKSSVA